MNYKSIVFIFLIITNFAFAQLKLDKEPAKDWYMQALDVKTNFGLDLPKAYNYLMNKKSTEIIVAVIDGGTEISHPDLKANIWKNPKEIPWNNIDDDGNGYVDDTCGWNFIGNKNGECVEFDNLEKVRRYAFLRDKYVDADENKLKTDLEKTEYAEYKTLKKVIQTAQERYELQKRGINSYESTMKIIWAKQKENIALTNHEEKTYAYLKSHNAETEEKYYELKKYFEIYADYNYNTEYDSRKIVGDNYANQSERFYGNNNVCGGDPEHGSHVAGIIGAVRNNKEGIDGIATNVKLMILRVVPQGDERDKDVANAIRYAVDNGAKVINMSFGKSHVFNKSVVDSAVLYAESKGVLLVHAAGNDYSSIDITSNYPNDSIRVKGSFASNWIEVGASTWNKNFLSADFSNYGKHNVDVFAPGYKIYSTVTNHKYKFENGTSMASPVCAGVAALLWSYFPSLTAVQVKECIEKGVVVYSKKVKKSAFGKRKVSFKDLSKTGGVINAYNSIMYAEKLLKK